ncbi:MAG TPA: hypothetical protein VEY50_05735 [Lysobacter sp.]|nr:hypothetical protein [Lysobacter sp.]
MRRLLVAVFALTLPAAAQAGQATGTEAFVSRDTDGSAVTRVALTWDPRFDDIEHYVGIKMERARLVPSDRNGRSAERVYLRFADTGARWKWNGNLGTDGDTWLGNASLYTEERFRQEYFVEREIIETRQGLDRGLYYTLAGAAFDLPVNDRHIFTAMLGVQDFTGENRRYHFRGRYIAVIKPEWGLSAQLRVRYAHSTEPGEFDYYSPRWYAEAIPTVQVRRYRGGWIYQGALGWGRQQDSGAESSQRARLAEFIVTSPRRGRDWYLRAGFTYTDTPTLSGANYGYRQFTLQALKTF